MQPIPFSKARAAFSEVVSRAEHDGERVLLSRNGKNVAAVVPMEDVTLLEQLEDATDLAAIRSALAETKRLGEKPIPWSKARKLLGL